MLKSSYEYLRQTVNRGIAEFLLRNIPGNDLVVIEAGAGSGYTSSLLRLSPRLKMALALDIDREPLLHARERDMDLDLVRADLFNMPFPDETFDIVWSNSALEHFPDHAAAMRQMARIAKTGGHVAIGVPYYGGPLRVERLAPASKAGVWIGPTFTEDRLAGLFNDAGLTVETKRIFFLRFFIMLIGKKT